MKSRSTLLICYIRNYCLLFTGWWKRNSSAWLSCDREHTEFEIVPRRWPRKQSFKFCMSSNISDCTQIAQKGVKNSLFEPALLDLTWLCFTGGRSFLYSPIYTRHQGGVTLVRRSFNALFFSQWIRRCRCRVQFEADTSSSKRDPRANSSRSGKPTVVPA